MRSLSVIEKHFNSGCCGSATNQTAIIEMRNKVKHQQTHKTLKISLSDCQIKHKLSTRVPLLDVTGSASREIVMLERRQDQAKEIENNFFFIEIMQFLWRFFQCVVTNFSH